MVIQNNVKKIIALAGSVGTGYGMDCSQYFPNESRQFQRIELNGIYITKDTSYEDQNEIDYVQRKFIIRRSDNKPIHELHHIQFKTWNMNEDAIDQLQPIVANAASFIEN